MKKLFNIALIFIITIAMAAAISAETQNTGPTDTSILGSQTYSQPNKAGTTAPKTTNTAPQITAIPDKEITENSTNTITIDLYNYISDAQDSDSELTIEGSQGNGTLIPCTLEDERYLVCGPPAQNQTGTNDVEITVTDTGGLSANTSFTLTVTPDETNTPPIMNDVGEVRVEENSSTSENTRLVDLWAYVEDIEDDRADLIIERTSQTDASLISCYIESNRWLNCSAPTYDYTGTNRVILKVTDTDGASDTAEARIVVYKDSDDDSGNSDNDAPELRNLPDVRVRENAGYSDELIDLWDYASDYEDDDDELDYRIVSQSNTSLIYCKISNNHYFECEAPRDDRTGESTVKIEVEDRNHRTDTDIFTVEVTGSDDGFCSDIRVRTKSVTIDEDDVDTFTFEIENYSDSDFTIDDMDVSESSSYLDVTDTYYPGTIYADDQDDIEIEFEADTVSSDKSVTVTLEIEGEFDEGSRCRGSDIKKTFTVRIDNEGSSGSDSSICDDISIEVDDYRVDEDKTTTKTVTLVNDSDSRFTINSISTSENSSYFNLSTRNTPSRINSEDEETFDLRINTENVSTNKKDDAQIRVSGRFSNGKICSVSSINEKFYVTVLDEDSSDDDSDDNDDSDNGSTGQVLISVSDSIINLDEGDSRTVNVSITNNTDKSECFVASAVGGAVASASVLHSNTCLSENSASTIPVTINARKEGRANVEIRIEYGNTTKSKFVTVNVEGRKEQEPVIIVSAESVSADNEEGIVILKNNGEALNEVTIETINAPEGLEFQKVIKEFWNSGDTVELKFKNTGFEGNEDAIIKITSKNQSKAITITVEGNTKEDTLSGLIGLATAAGTGIGLIILLILAVIGITAIITKK